MKSTTQLTDNVPTGGEFGEPFRYDPNFSGPVKSRSCTDILCLFLFVAFLAGWVVVCVFAFKTGSPRTLIYPTDSHGHICGSGPLQSKPYLYFFDITKCAKPSVVKNGCKTPQVCVSTCPNETTVVLPTMEKSKVENKLICQENTDMTKSLARLLEDGDCASLYIKSIPMLGRCIPSQLSTVGDTLVDNNNATITDIQGKGLSAKSIKLASKLIALFLNAKEVGKRVVSDIKTSWHLILFGLLLCMCLSFLWVVIMRFIAAPMVWLSIILVLLLSIYGTVFSAKQYSKYKKLESSDKEFANNIDTYSDSKKTWLVLTIICGVLFVILFLMLIFLRKRILLAISLIKEGSRAVGCMMSTLLFPLFPFFMQILLFCLWGTITLYLASSGKPTYILTSTDDSKVSKVSYCNPDTYNGSEKCSFHSYGHHENLYSGQFYNLFIFLWSVFFTVGICQLSLAGAFATYYWKMNKKHVPSFAVWNSFYCCIRYHLGSVAFGSLIITIVRMIRILLEYIDRKCKKYPNAVTRGIIIFCKCCFWILEKFLKFVNKNAFIMMAVYGNNFCTSAKAAVSLLFRNAIRVFVLDKVTDFLLILGKLTIVFTCGILSFYVFTGQINTLNPALPELNYHYIPVFIITFGAYVISTLFFNVYGMAVDTLFLCFLEDSERNDGSPEKPYFMSKELMKILDKSNKFREPEEK